MSNVNREWKNRVKLIAFDLDGTLLNHEQVISPTNREALRKLQAIGYKLVVTTGRTLPEAREVCEDIPFDGYVCSNGMLCFDGSQSLVNKETLTSAAVVEILEQLRAHDINYEMHDEHGDIYVIEEDIHFIKQRLDKVIMKPKRELLSKIESGDLGIVKFLILTRHTNVVITDHLAVQHLPVSLIVMNPHNVEINKSGIDKWIGLQQLLNRFNVSGDEVLAFGDSTNDLEILRQCGWSVAMGNAGVEVKNSANDLTLSHREDGVAYYLENWFLQRLG